MRSDAKTPQAYLDSLPEDRKAAIGNIRQLLMDKLPEGFEEQIAYGMLGYVIPHSMYPDGYHCDPKQALPFISLASQKNHISVYHMGLYEGKLLDWFLEEWPKHSSKKLDMGKCCIRFKNSKDIPYELLGQLFTKITPERWIQIYEENLKSHKSKK